MTHYFSPRKEGAPYHFISYANRPIEESPEENLSDEYPAKRRTMGNQNYQRENQIDDFSKKIEKNIDTGEVLDLKEADQHLEQNLKSNFHTKLKKNKNLIWKDWWAHKKAINLEFMAAVKANNLKKCVECLDSEKGDLKADVNYKDEKQNCPLHYACFLGSYDIVILILKNEADLEIQNDQGQTPLLVAAAKGHAKILSILLVTGAELNHQDNKKNTALHLASLGSHVDAVDLLLRKPSINTHIRNDQHKTAHELANSFDVKILFDEHFAHKNAAGGQFKDIQIKYANEEQLEAIYNLRQRTISNHSEDHLDYNHEISNSMDFSTSDEYMRVSPSSFRIHCVIGKGSFGEVYLVNMVSKPTKFYAMKVINKSTMLKHNLIQYAKTERNVLRISSHPFIVKLYFAFQSNEELFLILKYCSGGDLAMHLKREKTFSEDKARFYAAEILLGLEYLHKQDIIYRDLKPSNVVLDEFGHAHLTDFGLSKEGIAHNAMTMSFCGSMAYLAPEMIKKSGHGKAVDWYLFGVLLYEMLTGSPPFMDKNKFSFLKSEKKCFTKLNTRI